MDTSTKRMWALCATVLGAGTIVALMTFSVPSESTAVAQPTVPEASARTAGATRDPSLSGLSVAADARSDDVEIFY